MVFEKKIERKVTKVNRTRSLAETICAIGYEDLPETTVRQARMAVLDNLGNALGACDTPVGKIFLESCSAPVDGGCVVWGTPRRAAMMEAGFVNASLAQVLDFDDTVEIESLAVSHPGPAVVPAALAAGETVRCSGKALIRGVTLGYEVATRLARAIEPRRDDFWGFGNSQVMGAAAAAATIFDLSAPAMVNALGIAAACAPVPNTNRMWGLETRPMSWVKDGVGIAAATGLTSALLARNGLFGCQDALDGRSGYHLLCGSADYKGEEIVKGLGSDFSIDRLSFKPYPTCRFMQSSLDSIRLLVVENGLAAECIQSVEVHLPPYLAKVFAVYAPATMTDAQFSLPYAAAMVLTQIAPSPDWYRPENLSSRDILAVARKVRLIESAQVERRRAEENVLSPEVRIRTSDGAVYERQEYCAKGHPRKPFTRHDFEQKFLNNTTAVIGKARANQVMRAIDRLDGCSDISELTGLVRIEKRG